MLRTLFARTLLVGLAIGAWDSASTCYGATKTWDGGGNPDGNWMTGANWDLDGAPTPTTDDLIFDGMVNLTTNNNFPANSVFNGFTFETLAAPGTAGAFTLNGNSVTLGGSQVGNLVSGGNFAGSIINGITNNSGVLQTVNLGLRLQRGRHTFNGGPGGLALNPAGGLLRDLGGLADFTLGSGITTSTITNTNGIIGPWATIGGTDYATVSGGSIVAATYTDVAAGGVIANGPTTNVRINSNGGAVTLGPGTTEINSLLYNVAAAQTVTVGAGNTLRVGGIMRGNAADATALTVGTANVGNITINAPLNTAGELILHGNGTSATGGGITVNSTITNNGTGAVTVVKTGLAAGALGGTNTYSGGTIIAEGRLNGGTGAFGTGPIYVLPGGQLFSAGTFNNPIFISGTGTTENNGNGAIRSEGGVFNGTVTLIGNARIQKRTGNAGNPPNFNGQITGPYSLEFGGNSNDNSDFPIIRINNPANDWTGDTRISESSRLRLGNNEVIPNGVGFGNVLMSNTRGAPAGDVDNWTILDLNGFNETINGLNSNITINDSSQVTVENNAVGTTSVLTIGDNNQTSNFGGQIRDFNSDTANGGAATGGTLAITKIGTGTLTLNTPVISAVPSSHAYTGATTVNGGTLALVSTLTNNIASSGTITVGASGTLDVTGLSGGEIALGTQSLVNNGTVTGGVTAATGSVKGTGTYGNVTISGGALAPGGSVGTVNINNLSMTAGTWQVELQGTNADRVNVTSANFSGGTIEITPAGLPTGTSYTILSGAWTGTLPTLANTQLGRMTFGLTSTANSVTLTQTGQAASLRWDTTGGTGDNVTWDNNVNQNWKNVSGGAAENFFDFDSVLFNDANGGGYNVTVAGSVKPLSVTIDNNAGDYSIGGSGSIDGAAGITKTGTRMLTLSGTNNGYTGATVLNGGIVNVAVVADAGVSSSIGAASADPANLVVNGSTLRYTGGAAVTNRGMTLGTAGATFDADGTGAVEFNGTKVMAGTNTARTITLTGDNVDLNRFSGIADNGTGATSVVKSGPGTWQLDTNSYSGPTNIQSGKVVSSSSASFGALPGGDVTVASGATLDIGGNLVTNGTNYGQKHFKIAGTGVGNVGALINGNAANGQQNAFQKVTLTANATVAATGRFDLRNGPPVLDLAGFTLTKKGTAHFGIVSGTVTDGNIVVEEGLLAFEGNSTVQDFGTGKKLTFQNGSTLQFFGTSGTITRPMEFNGAVTVHNNDDATSTFSSPVLLKGDATYTFVADNDPPSITVQNGPMSDDGTPRSIIVNTQTVNSGLALGGNNTYTGTTTINGQGFLRVNGSHTGAGNYSVAIGATLGGNGTITPAAGANVAVQSGGILAPGAGGVGTLTFNGSAASSPVLSLDAGASLLFDLNNTLQYDRVNLINGAANDIAFNDTVINFNDLTVPVGGLTGGDYTLFSANVAGAYSGLTVAGGVITAGLTIGTGLDSYATKELRVSGNNIILRMPFIGTLLAGDYNGNGVVDTADYVVWRKNVGSDITLPGRTTTGAIGTSDYDVWRANFGKTLPGSGGGAGQLGAVPEPGAIVLGLLALIGVVFLRSRGA